MTWLKFVAVATSVRPLSDSCGVSGEEFWWLFYEPVRIFT